MKLNILPLNQRDERWKLKRLGNSNVTLGNYGCLLTCHSMFLRYLGQDLFPDALNEVYKNKNVFDPQGNINFWAAGTAFENTWNAEERYECMEVACDLSKIDKLLDKKMPVIAKVDFDANPATTGDWHYVLIIGKENNSYLINDPWTGETYFFEAKYGPPERMIYGLRIYVGKEVPNGTSCEDKLSDCLVSLKSTTDSLAGKTIEVDDFRKRLEDQERDNRDLANQVLESRNQRDQAIRQKNEMAKEVEKATQEIEGLNKGIESRDEEIEGLKTALSGLTAINLDTFSNIELAKELFRRILYKKRG